jgi:hypothetical protein
MGDTDKAMRGSLWYKIREKTLQKNRILLTLMKTFSSKEVDDADNLAHERPHEITATESSTTRDKEHFGDISKAWLINSLPEFCYANKGNNHHRCPKNFPDLVGNLCFGPCQPFEHIYKSPSEHKVKPFFYKRDQVGTCRQTCNFVDKEFGL